MAAFSSFLLAVDTLGSYLMSNETSIFSVHWKLRGISKYRFLIQFCELAISATAQSPTFVTRDQSLKDVQS